VVPCPVDDHTVECDSILSANFLSPLANTKIR
jgi:hypothetical protein